MHALAKLHTFKNKITKMVNKNTEAFCNSFYDKEGLWSQLD